MNARGEALPVWDLSDLYAGIDDPEIEADMERIKRQAAEFEARFKGTIAGAALGTAHLRQALDAYEALLRTQYRPQSFAMLLFSTDTRDPARGALLQKSREFGSAVAAHLVFFELEIGKIPRSAYETLIEGEALAPYRHYLEHQRALAAHNLSEPEEKILVQTANARGSAFARLFTEIHGRTRYSVDLEDERKELSQEEVLALFYHPQRQTRRRAATALTAGLEKNSHVCTFIYNTLLHEKEVLDRLRRYPAPESNRHLDNELEEGIVDTVVEVCTANYDLVARYYHLKRRLLGVDELTHYDRYAPLGETRSEIPFGRARRIVLEAFDEFSPRLRRIARDFFEKGWIDAVLSPGKRSGAFCAGITPDLHPYVLLNYTRQPRDVMTLAHELGHGVHDVLARRNHLLDYHPVLPVAETASTFGEMLVFDKLQRELESDEERLALLCGKIEESFATVFRQVAMYRFEQRAHRARREQGELPAEHFGELWQQSMQEVFGEALKLGAEHACWWLYIPHLVSTPFYVYAYAFGELLVLALYARYREERGEAGSQARPGADFVERYFGLLAAGGSRPPVELLAAMGIDIAQRAFWQRGCDLIRQRVELAEKLAEKLAA